METHSNEDAERSVHSSLDPTDRKAACVAEAALRDGERDPFMLDFIDHKAAEHMRCPLCDALP